MNPSKLVAYSDIKVNLDVPFSETLQGPRKAQSIKKKSKSSEQKANKAQESLNATKVITKQNNYYKSNPPTAVSVTTIAQPNTSQQKWGKSNQNSKSQTSFRVSQNFSSKKTFEMLQLNQTNNNAQLKFTVPTFARVNLDKINHKTAKNPIKHHTSDKKSGHLSVTTKHATKLKAQQRAVANEHEAYTCSNDSGLLNPLIEQLLKDLPSVNPSELGTGKIFEKQT